MKTPRKYGRLRVGSDLLCRQFSFLAIDISQNPNIEPEELVCVGTSATTHVGSLHGLLQLSARIRPPMEGKAGHALVIRFGFQTDTLTSNMLIDLYSKCGLGDCARKVFDEMPDWSLVSWNTMIASLTLNGEAQEALGLFVKMQREGTASSDFTVSSVLCACAAKYAVFECKQLHTFAIKAAMESNMFVGTALLDVYAKCSLIKDASLVFESMPERSAVTWSSMVARTSICFHPLYVLVRVWQL